MKYPSSNLTNSFTVDGSRISFAVHFFPSDLHLRSASLILSEIFFNWIFFNLKEDESHEEQQELNNQNDDSDHFSEVDETDLHVGNTDTLLDEIASIC
jgi:hypothetical protein